MRRVDGRRKCDVATPAGSPTRSHGGVQAATAFLTVRDASSCFLEDFGEPLRPAALGIVAAASATVRARHARSGHRSVSHCCPTARRAHVIHDDDVPSGALGEATPLSRGRSRTKYRPRAGSFSRPCQGISVSLRSIRYGTGLLEGRPRIEVNDMRESLQRRRGPWLISDPKPQGSKAESGGGREFPAQCGLA